MTRLNASLAALCASLLVCPHVFAVELGKGFDLALELTAVSDYRDRAISQSLGDPAIQASGTLISPVGAYVGVWGSSVDFGLDLDTRMEQDVYAGWYIPLTDELLLDVGYLKYMYPNNSELNSSYYYAVATYKGAELGYQYSTDRNGNQDGGYTYLAYTYELDETTRAYVKYGESDAKDDVIFSGSGDVRSRYRDWEARLEKDFVGLTWKASLIDSDLSETECINNTGYDDLCSATLVVGVSKYF